MGKIEQTITAARILFAGTGSNCGKTTITCAVLGALQNQGHILRAYKCGPDYIDPMFHTKILGIPSRNLDSFLLSEDTVRYLFARNSPSHVLSIVEGVMGYYDGLGGQDEASSHHIAQILNIPVVLVVNCKGKALSLAAQLQGFQNFRPNRILGVILNGATDRTYAMYRVIVEENTNLEVLGYLPYLPEASIRSRHLGLVTADEIKDLRTKMRILADTAGRTICLERLVKLANEAGPLTYSSPEINRMPVTVPIGIARDDAFCFYYRDSLDLLEMLGAKLIPFSPVADEELPTGLSGIILGGGYPELYARQLSYNVSMITSISQAMSDGIPTLAECGGFLYLCKELAVNSGDRFPMVGVINAKARMTNRLNHFGYVTLTAQNDNLICLAGERIPAHEFHYSTVDGDGNSFTAEKASGLMWQGVHATSTMYAGYPHMHLWSNIELAKRFLKACITYRGTAQ